MKNYDWTRISQLIALKKTGTATPDELEELNVWVSARPEHGKLLEKMLGGDGLAETARIARTFDLDSAKRNIQAGINLGARRRRNMLIGSIAAISAAAACAIIIISLGGRNKMFYEFSDPRSNDNHIRLELSDGRSVNLEPTGTGDEWMAYAQTESVAGEEDRGETPDAAAGGMATMKVVVPRGQNYKLQLPDDSFVWLNSESSIEYPAGFASDRRAVTLTGEAFFDVVYDASRPFAISTRDNLNITVLGTRFNVNSYADVEYTSVSLVEGSVSVAHADNSVVLRPNQQAIFDRAGKTLQKRDIDDAAVYSAWMNGMFEFNGETVDVILDAMAKWYDIRFDAGDMDLRSLGHFTLSAPRSDEFRHVGEILQKITGLKFHREGNTVFLSY